MITQPELTKRTVVLRAVGTVGILLGLSLIVNLLLTMPAQGKGVKLRPAMGSQQPIVVNGRPIYAVPIVTGPTATAILQEVPAHGLAYVVHAFDGWGKSVSTTRHWFRCADIVNVNQYNGNQTEIELWTLLTEQERMESQAACSLS